ncbi:hypothetical protein SDC9_167595 [bioreactor metagenome]|uniref:Uncharacterized protein n=1 Tax=bioreactor metagenome TaxID=1076179 RepID=A0A645G071_9ZZZZ
MAVSDVDSGRANHHALIAVYTVSFSDCFSIFAFSPFGPVFSPFKVIIHIDRLLINQYALQSAIRTNQGTNLLTEPGECEVESRREQNHDHEIGQIHERSFLHDSENFFVTHDVHEHPMRDDQRNKNVNSPFKESFPDFFGVPFLSVKFHLFVSVSFNRVFNFSENHFHENGLRTNPTTKDPTKNHGKQNNENNGGNCAQCEDKEILRIKRLPQNKELPIQNIDQQQWISVNFHERQHKKHYK